MAVGLLKQVLLQDLSILPSLGHLGNEVVSKLLLGFRSTRVPILGFDPSILPSFLSFSFLFFFLGGEVVSMLGYLYRPVTHIHMTFLIHY
jgi:hypothetical protein